MQPITNPGTLTQLGQSLVIDGAGQVRRTLDQGDPLPPFTTGHQPLQPGDERGNADPGAKPERLSLPGGTDKGAIRPRHCHWAIDPGRLDQLAGMIPQRPHRNHQLTLVGRHPHQGKGVRPLLGIKLEEGKLAWPVVRQRRLQLQGEFTGTVRQGAQRHYAALMAIPLTGQAQQGVNRSHSPCAAQQRDPEPHGCQQANLGQQAETVYPPRQIDERRKTVDHPKAAIAHQRQQAHHHQGYQQIEAPLPQRIAKGMQGEAIASPCSRPATSPPAGRPGQPAGRHRPLGCFHQQPVTGQGQGRGHGAVTMEPQHAIQPATPDFQPRQTQRQQQGQRHVAQPQQTGQQQHLMAPGPDAVGIPCISRPPDQCRQHRQQP